jgi:pimeloyl-ACP methyl ester carboxylesterase
MRSNSLQKDQRSPVQRLAEAAFAAAGVLGALALLNNVRARLAERDNPPLGDFLDIDDVRLHYLERGKGPPLVLLHGNGAMIQDFMISGILDRLAGRYRVIAIDRPGFGCTTRPRTKVWTAAAQADLVAEALHRLEAERAIVLGHSWGTLVALSLALDHPERVKSLVLLAGYYFPSLRAEAMALSIAAAPIIGDVLDWTVAPVLGYALRRWVFRKLFAPAAVPPRFSAEFPIELALRPSQIKASAAETELMAGSAAAIAGRYGDLDMPVVILAAKRDAIVDFAHQAQRLAEAVPGAILRPVDDAGHMIHHLVPDEVIEAVALAAATPSQVEDRLPLQSAAASAPARGAHEPAISHPRR